MRTASRIAIPVLLLVQGFEASERAHSQSEARSGYATLTAAAGSSLPAGALLLRQSNPDGVLTAEALLLPVSPFVSGSITVDEGGTRTGVILVNGGAMPAAVELTLRDSEGLEIGRRSLDLAGGTRSARLIEDLFPDLPAAFTGSVEIHSDNPVVAAATRSHVNRHGETFDTLLPARGTQPPVIGTRVVPEIGVGAGYSTTLFLANDSDLPARGRIELRDATGSGLPADIDGASGTGFSYSLKPRGSRKVLLESAAQPAGGYAVVMPHAGSPMPGVESVVRLAPGGELISEAATAFTEPTARCRLYLETAEGQPYIAVADAGSQSGLLTFRLLDPRGSELETAQRELPANGYLALPAADLFPRIPGEFAGLVEISGTALFSAGGLKITENERGEAILSALPLADLARPARETQRVFAAVAFGDGLTTKAILLSPARGEPASGLLRLVRDDGSPLPAPLAAQSGSVFPWTVPADGVRLLDPGNGVPVARVAVLDPESGEETSEIVVGENESAAIRVAVTDASGATRHDLEVDFEMVSPDVAGVDVAGVIQGRKPGFTTLAVSAGGQIATATVTVVRVEGGAGGFGIGGIALAGARRVYLASPGSHAILSTPALDQSPQLLAGVTNIPGLKDDSRLSALFNGPSSLALDSRGGGALYVADTANHAIRRVELRTGGGVRTLAGGERGANEGAVELVQARFDTPRGIALDGRGGLWVSDSGNHTVRRIDLLNGTVEVVAGKPGSPGFADGVGAEARFSFPAGIALEQETIARRLEREKAGSPPPPVTVLVADAGNGSVRRVRDDGTVETLRSGSASPSNRRRAALSEAVRFESPESVVADPFGNIYVAERGAGRIRALLADGNVVAATPPGLRVQPSALAIPSSGNLLVADTRRAVLRLSFGAPSIEGLAPGRIPREGGVRVRISGRNFAPETIVVVSGTVIEGVEIADSSNLSFVAPPLPNGRGTVTILNRGGLAQAPIVVDAVPLSRLLPGRITTVAGGATFTGDGAAALAAAVASPEQVAVDFAGNIFFADTAHHQVRRVDAASGIITTIAGIGTFGFSGDGGPAVAARLTAPAGLAIDPAGNVYVSDTGNSRVRRVDAATGLISTVAGAGLGAPLGDGGPASSARLNAPRGLAFDPAGGLLIADSGNHRVRRVDPSGVISTVAGNGEPGFTGDGSAAISTRLNSPRGIAADDQGTLIIGDTLNHRIRRVGRDGVIETIAGTGRQGFSGDRRAPSAADFDLPQGVAVDGEGNIIVADSGNHRVRLLNLRTSLVSTLAGDGLSGDSGDGGPAVNASLRSPTGVAVDSAGSVLVADRDNHRIRRLTADDGRIAAVAGSGAPVYLGDGGAAAAANLRSPSGIALDPQGNLWIADRDNHRVRRVDGATGAIETVVGTGTGDFGGDGGPAFAAAVHSPQGLASDGQGRIYIADTLNHRVRRVDADGRIRTVAGNGREEYSGDGGAARYAGLSYPTGVAVDIRGNLLIADAGNNRVRRVDAVTGEINTFAGTGFPGFSGDGGPARAAALKAPQGLAVDPFGNTFVADASNNRIRRVDGLTGVITTVAGNGERGFGGDGMPAAEASLDYPLGLAVDLSGRIFVLDTFNNRVRAVDPLTGIIRTVAGDGNRGFSGDGDDAVGASIFLPEAALIDPDGNLLFSDAANDRVRAVRAAAEARGKAGSFPAPQAGTLHSRPAPPPR